MKTNLLPVIAFLAPVAAVALLPVSAVAAVIALSATGLLSVFASDYARSVEPVRAQSQVVAFSAPRPSAEYRNAA
jgi:hypothetical protein